MKILIIAYPDLSKDPRPYRQIKSLSKEHEVYTVGASSSGLENFFCLKNIIFYIISLG